MSDISDFIARRYGGLDPRNGPIMEHLELLWKAFEPYADPHFLAEFCGGDEERFQQRYWEMLLCSHLLTTGLQLEPTDGAGPDFKIHLNDGRTLWIEAVSPTQGRGQNQIPDLPLLDVNSDEPQPGVAIPEGEILLRYTTAVENKRAKREVDIQAARISANDPFIIALNSSQLGLFSWLGASQNPAAIEAVYPAGHQQLHIDPNNLNATRADLQYRPAIQNANQIEIRTDGFLSPHLAGITALIATSRSEYHIFDVPPTPIILIHNITATQTLRPSLLRVNTEYHVETNGPDCRIVSTPQ